MTRKTELETILGNIEAYIDEMDGYYDLYFTGDGWECNARRLDESDIDNDELIQALKDGQEIWEVSDCNESEEVIGRAAAIKWMVDSIDTVLSNELDDLLSEEKMIEDIKDETVYLSSPNPQASGWSVFGIGDTEPTIEGTDIYADTYRVNLRSMTVQQAYANYDVPADSLANAWNDYRQDQEAKRELNAVMTVKEVADTYHLNETGIRATIDRGAIPARQSGATWLIRRADADKRWSKHLPTLVFALWLAGCMVGIGL